MLINTPRYHDLGTGVVYDKHTRLYWLREPLGPAEGAPEPIGFWQRGLRGLRWWLISIRAINPDPVLPGVYTGSEALQVAEKFTTRVMRGLWISIRDRPLI